MPSKPSTRALAAMIAGAAAVMLLVALLVASRPQPSGKRQPINLSELREIRLGPQKPMNSMERWNAFVHLCFMNKYEDLKPLQRTAHLALWYEHEVNNGGHAQYFDNRGNERVPETIQALRDIGANQFAEILASAFEAHIRDGGRIENWSDETSEAADELDRRFGAAQPHLPELLERFLDAKQDAFVEIVEKP